MSLWLSLRTGLLPPLLRRTLQAEASADRAAALPLRLSLAEALALAVLVSLQEGDQLAARRAGLVSSLVLAGRAQLQTQVFDLRLHLLQVPDQLLHVVAGIASPQPVLSLYDALYEDIQVVLYLHDGRTLLLLLLRGAVARLSSVTGVGWAAVGIVPDASSGLSVAGSTADLYPGESTLLFEIYVL